MRKIARLTEKEVAMLSLGVNSVFEIQALSAGTDSTRPSSTVASQLSNFQVREGAIEKKPFKTFYTNSEKEENKVTFERQNKFAGKSNFMSYIPASKHLDERVMEAKWFEY
jgi:hypothetical protein